LSTYLTYLLDVNVLIALAWPQHIHHEAAHRWFAQTGGKSWATCAITQLAFVRISSNPGIIADAVSPTEAAKVLLAITQLAGHTFWPQAPALDQIEEMQSLAIVGHRQVTDAYLLGVARHHNGRLATFDRGLRDLAAGTKTARANIELLEAR
jgi:uncharacterized protein